ncbi:MAG: GNAT family N-acetyltransferase [Moraxella sp.]|nr:GNAT family N-acetyltransferase [Moraxella sp.]
MDKYPLQQIPTLHKFGDDDHLLFAQVLNNEQVMANVTGSAISEDDIQDAWNNRVRIINRQCELFGYYKIMVDAHYAGYVKIIPNDDIFTKPCIEIGYFLLPEFWGKGIGFMVGRQLVKLAKSQNLPIIATVNRKKYDIQKAINQA